MNGTGFTVCAVWGSLVSGFTNKSAFPWSAVINTAPSSSNTFLTICPVQLSTAWQAWTTASTFPVCPTMSGFAKFNTTVSTFPVFNSLIKFSLTS